MLSFTRRKSNPWRQVFDTKSFVRKKSMNSFSISIVLRNTTVCFLKGIERCTKPSTQRLCQLIPNKIFKTFPIMRNPSHQFLKQILLFRRLFNARLHVDGLQKKAIPICTVSDDVDQDYHLESLFYPMALNQMKLHFLKTY